ncbi:MAG: hypothetical protein KKC64_14795 [Spirochaetes bacterium]|nr:hypothetical protein [Spirochaetota bacterium]
MGFLFQGINAASALALLAFVIGFVLLNEIARRSKIASLLLFCVLPVVLAIAILSGLLGGSPAGKTWFAWVKVVSALTGVYGFLLIRFTKLGKKKFAIIFPVAILALNIAEAVYRELEVFASYATRALDPAGNVIMGGPWNVLNAIAGIITIVTLTGFVGIRVSNTKSKDMIWPDMTWLYIAGYTLWNFAYVYNCISNRAMYAGLGILVAAVIAEYMFKRGAWLQHRAQILSLYAMFSLSLDFQGAAFFRILPTYSTTALWFLGIVSIVFNLGVLASMLFMIFKHKKNPLREEIYAHTMSYQAAISANSL